jgi:hypothetical protein
MRIGSVADASDQLLLLLAAAQRQPALLRRRKQRSPVRECEELQRFCDEVAARAQARGLTEEKLVEILAE